MRDRRVDDRQPQALPVARRCRVLGAIRIRTDAGWLSLAIVLDEYSHHIVGGARAPSMPAELVYLAALRYAWPLPNEIRPLD